jgi:hypothetical protein
MKPSKKSPFKGKFSKKAPSMEAEKAPSMEDEKASSYYLPALILGVMGKVELRALLTSKRQKEWTSEKRIGGLLLIIDFVARKGGTVSMSSELSRQYVSTFKRAKNPSTIKQPLALLVHLGILEIVQNAVVTPHRKASTKYRLSSAHGKPRPFKAVISRQQVEKQATAKDRQQRHLNRKHRTRAKILADLLTLALSPEGELLAAQMILRGEKSQGIGRFLKPLKDPALHKVTFDPSGTAHHFAMYCPRELKPHLTLGEKPVALVDMKAAHLVALLCVGRGRVSWLAKEGRDTQDLEAELARYKATLETSDIYEALGGTADRKKFKLTLLASLNMATSKAIYLPPYQSLKCEFPRLVGILEDIKKKDHRALSKQLQFFTAQIIEGATHEAQAAAIACLPDTDALIVPRSCETLSRHLLNNAIREVTSLNPETPYPSK